MQLNLRHHFPNPNVLLIQIEDFILLLAVFFLVIPYSQTVLRLINLFIENTVNS